MASRWFKNRNTIRFCFEIRKYSKCINKRKKKINRVVRNTFQSSFEVQSARQASIASDWNIDSFFFFLFFISPHPIHLFRWWEIEINQEENQIEKKHRSKIKKKTQIKIKNETFTKLNNNIRSVLLFHFIPNHSSDRDFIDRIRQMRWFILFCLGS